MDTTLRKTRWQNAFIYALVTTVMVLGSASIISVYAGEGQRELAERVDENAAIAVTASDTIICILRLGVGENAPPRSDANVVKCMEKNGYIDIPAVTQGVNNDP